MNDECRVDKPFETDVSQDRAQLKEPKVNEQSGNTTEEPALSNVAEAQANQIRELEIQARETYERLLRVAADFENYRKRAEREKQEYVRFATERLVRDLLPVLDNLGRAVQHARQLGEGGPLLAGVELVLQELQKVLERYGVRPIQSSVGQPFDPSVHEALQVVEVEDMPPGQVVEEIQTGYTLNGKVIRPALVTVSTAPEQTTPGAQSPQETR